jgi:hypothetical protein
MNTFELKTIHSILHLTLRPWETYSYSDAKFKEMFSDLKHKNNTTQWTYEVEFPRPLGTKRRYYHAIIQEEVNNYLNELNLNLEKALIDEERIFWVRAAIKTIKQKFNKTYDLILERGIFFELLNSPKTSPNLASDIYIIQYLKFQLIRLYLEIQDTYPTYIQELQLSESDLISLYFKNDVQSNPVVIKSEKAILQLKQTNTISPITEPAFQPF